MKVMLNKVFVFSDPPALKMKAFRNNYHRNSIGTQLYDTPKAFL